MPDNTDDFTTELTSLINRHNMENHNELVIPNDRAVIDVWRDDQDQLQCAQFGRVHDWKPKLMFCHSRGAGPICVHRLRPLPPTQLFSPDWIARLGWQLQTLARPVPIIARRRDDIVTLGVDVIGGAYKCNHHPVGVVENRWHYLLYRMRWWDDDTPVSDDILLGVAQ